MILQETDNYIKACMKTWLLRESCIHTETMSESPREEIVKRCRTCANACFTVVCRIINHSEALQESVFICLLHCRECIDECKKHRDSEELKYCADICGLCADILKPLLLPDNLN